MRGVRPAIVVEVKVRFELGVDMDQRHVALQINFLIFHPPPQPFDEHIAEAPAS